MRAALTLSLLAAVALLAPAPVSSAVDAAEPSPEALAKAWFEQRFGGDAVEIWRTSWAAHELIFGVARRWKAERPEVFFKVQKPRQYDEMAFLLKERDDGATQVLYYRTPQLFPAGKKAARVMPVAKPDLIERLPFVPGLPAIAMVWPSRAQDFEWKRLPDQDMWGQHCRQIEGRPKQTDPSFDRFVASLSKETGVAVDTQWFKNGKLVRRVTAAPEDVKDYDGRHIPMRLVVEVPGQQNQEFRIERLMLDAEVPDQLFATANLKTGRFPSY